jgi:hypothetical protein
MMSLALCNDDNDDFYIHNIKAYELQVTIPYIHVHTDPSIGMIKT